jgi:Tfp pilus assembly protein PilO
MATLSKGTVKLMGFSGVGLLLILGGFGIVSPLLEQIKANELELASSQDSNSALESNIASLKQVQTENDNVEKINLTLLKQFPELADVPGLLDAISGSADIAGISPSNITSIDFSIPELSVAPAADAPAEGDAAATDAAPAEGDAAAAPTSNMASMKLSINVNGSARQFQIFMDELTTMTRVLTINSFNITLDEEAGSGTLSIESTTFLYAHIKTPDEQGAGQTTETSGDSETVEATPSPTTAP